MAEISLLALASLTAGLLLQTSAPAKAEEGGSGHYFPGSMASFMDGVAPEEAFIARLNIIGYEGSVGADVPIPIAGLTVLNVDVESRALGATVFWRPSFEIGGNWSYAVSMTIPFVDLTVEADVAIPNDPLGRVRYVGQALIRPGRYTAVPCHAELHLQPSPQCQLSPGHIRTYR